MAEAAAAAPVAAGAVAVAATNAQLLRWCIGSLTHCLDAQPNDTGTVAGLPLAVGYRYLHTYLENLENLEKYENRKMATT